MSKQFVLLLIIALIQLWGFSLPAQKIKVLITSVEDIGNKLVIKYDFSESKESQRFNVTLEITSSTGQIIQANSLSGDLGSRISGGTNKQIIWDYVADGIVMKGNLNFEVIALVTSGSVNMTKSLLLSTALPGLGLSKMDKNKPYWLMGIVAYGCLGTSIFMNKKANDNYSLYLSNTDDNMNDELLSKSQSQNNISKTMAYTAIGIWSANLIWTIIRTKRKNKAEIGFLNNKKLFFITVYDPISKTKGFNIRYNF